MPPSDPDRRRLLFGPYRPSPLQKGDRAFCLYRDCDVIVTSWTAAPISWPRCRAFGAKSGSGLLVDEVLAWAVRHESSLALQHHFGVSARVVWCWRKALGVGQWEPAGSQRLHQQVSEQAATVVRGVPLPLDQVERRRRTAREKNLLQHANEGRRRMRGGHSFWRPEELALLGVLPDAEVAERTGRTCNGVRLKREKLGIEKAGGCSGERTR